MDEDVRTCGSCKGKAVLGGVVEHVTNVHYSAGGLQVGSEQLEGGSRITYGCKCGHSFTVINRLRRARFFGTIVFGGAFGAFWYNLASGYGRRGDGSMEGIFFLMAALFSLMAVVALVGIVIDIVNRLRNPPWREAGPA